MFDLRNGHTYICSTLEPYRAVLQAIFTLDLVAMMAGGRFQDVANTLVEAMEADALASTDPKRRCVGEMTGSVHAASVPVCPIGPDLKKDKHGRSMPTDELGKSGSIRRIQMPPLDVFQRDYMETETPVILSGVSERDIFENKYVQSVMPFRYAVHLLVIHEDLPAAKMFALCTAALPRFLYCFRHHTNDSEQPYAVPREVRCGRSTPISCHILPCVARTTVQLLMLVSFARLRIAFVRIQIGIASQRSALLVVAGDENVINHSGFPGPSLMCPLVRFCRFWMGGQPWGHRETGQIHHISVE